MKSYPFGTLIKNIILASVLQLFLGQPIHASHEIDKTEESPLRLVRHTPTYKALCSGATTVLDSLCMVTSLGIISDNCVAGLSTENVQKILLMSSRTMLAHFFNNLIQTHVLPDETPKVVPFPNLSRSTLNSLSALTWAWTYTFALSLMMPEAQLRRTTEHCTYEPFQTATTFQTILFTGLVLSHTLLKVVLWATTLEDLSSLRKKSRRK